MERKVSFRKQLNELYVKRDKLEKECGLSPDYMTDHYIRELYKVYDQIRLVKWRMDQQLSHSGIYRNIGVRLGLITNPFNCRIISYKGESKMLKGMKKVMDLGKGMIKSNVYCAKEIYGFLKENGFDGVSQNKILGETKLGNRDVAIIHNEFTFACLAQRNLPSAICMANKEYAAIIVNDAWVNAPKSIKHAIVAHELGHIVEGHLDNPLWSWKNNLKRMIGHDDSIKAEIAADSYADPEALNEFLVLAEKHHKKLGLPITEISQRMKVCNSRIFTIWCNSRKFPIWCRNF